MLAEADRELAQRDPQLPGLAVLFDAQRLQALLDPEQRHHDFVLNYLRYKPGVSCLAGVTMHTEAGVARWTVRAWAQGSSHRTDRHHPWTHNAERQLSWLPFPHDARLRGPRWLLERDTAEHARQRLLLPAVQESNIQLLTWKPERRVVLAIHDAGGPHAVVRCHEPRAYTRGLQASQALGAVPGLPVSAPLRWSDRRHIVVTPWVRGEGLSHVTTSATLFREAGALLATLHRSPTGALPSDSPGAGDEALRRVALDVQGLVPRLARAIEGLLARVGHESSTTHVVPCHGDFYVKQLLQVPQGLHLLDTDEAHVGDPLQDVALFVAHAERDACRGDISWARAHEIRSALLDGYGPTTSFDDAALDRAVARALLLLASHPFRHRATDWPQRIEELIDRAQTLAAAPARSPARTADLTSDDTLAFAQPLLIPARATAALAPLLPAGCAVRTASLRRHKTGRRCLIRWELGGGTRPEEAWLGKVRAKGADLRAFALHQALWRASQRDHHSAVSIPEPLGVLTMWRVTVQRAMPGVSPLAAVADGMPAEGVGALCGTALQWLHTSGVQSPRRWSVDDELGLLRERFGHLAEATPELRERLARLLRDLEVLAEPLEACERETLLHRDFYQDQLLIDRDRVTLLDLDLVAMGDPALDVGNMVAHLTDLGWREPQHATVARSLGAAFTDHLLRVHDGLTPDRVARWTCLALARLVEIASRFPDRRQHVVLLLTQLEELLSRGHDAAIASSTGTLLEVR